MSNAKIWASAQRSLVGGVNSPVRSFSAVASTPVPIVSGEKATLVDAEGKEYIDMICSWGAQIVGHAHPEVTQAVQAAAAQGLGFGALHPSEVELADLILEQLETSDARVRFVSSGTEATMTALRLARGATGRDKILKFDGGYHGHSDALLVAGGSGLATLSISSSLGVPDAAVANTTSIPFNDAEGLEEALSSREYAAVIVEPICGNMGMIVPDDGFLTKLRAICDASGTLLIADEVMTGFRAADGASISRLFHVEPDIYVFGKVVGGGLPAAALAGRAELMSHLAPVGKVYQAGTLSGNPLAMAAGAATLRVLEREGGTAVLDQRTKLIAREVSALGKEHGIPLATQAQGGMWGMFFAEQLPRNQGQVSDTGLDSYQRLFQLLLAQGILMPPSPWEAMFITLAHDEAIIDQFLAGFAQALKQF